MTRDYHQGRRARLPVIKALHGLGIALDWIASAIGCSIQTVCNDLQSIGLGNGIPLDLKVVFAVVFRRYACILTAEANQSQLNVEDKLIRQHLVDWLGTMDAVCLVFIRGLEMAMGKLAIPEYPAGLDEGYIKLICAIFDCDWKTGCYSDNSGQIFWKDYIEGIASGRIQAPTSRGALLSDLTDRYVRMRRNNIMPVWPDHTAEAIEKILKSLSERQERVIRMRFGIGQRFHTLHEVGQKFEVTQQRIRQIEETALRKLRHPSRLKYLQTLARPPKPCLHMPDASVVLVDPLSLSTPIRLKIEVLAMPVSGIEFSCQVASCLDYAGIRYVYELVQKSEIDMLRTKNIGRKSLKEVKEVLAEMNLSLGMQFDDRTKADMAEFALKASTVNTQSSSHSGTEASF